MHDCQLLDDSELPLDKMLVHDVPVDIIVTNTQVGLPPARRHHHLAHHAALCLNKKSRAHFVLG